MASHTKEDTEPRRREPWTLHQAGTVREYLRIALPVQLPADLYSRGRVVIRCYQDGEQRVTLAMETIRIE